MACNETAVTGNKQYTPVYKPSTPKTTTTPKKIRVPEEHKQSKLVAGLTQQNEKEKEITAAAVSSMTTGGPSVFQIASNYAGDKNDNGGFQMRDINKKGTIA